jgi:Aspartyl protease/PDZ domain
MLALPLLCILLCTFSPANAQYFDLEKNRKHVTIPFRIIRNMIIIKLRINDKGPFNFILDTGVGLMIITEPALLDSINLTSKRIIKIPGLGQGEDDEAYITSVLKVSIPGLESYDVSAAILKKDHFNLSNYAGTPIDGLLGYEFFANIAVKINFADSSISVCRPKDLRSFKKSNQIPISIEERKPYMQAKITFPNGKKVDSKLVIDIGAGHPISIENMIKNNGLPPKFIPANLGVGLNGPIEGFISRVNEVDIGKFKIKDVLASFPDDTKSQISPSVPRDGNLGIGILKKFEVIFDYPDNMLYLKPGPLFKEPFEHDMSGLEYYSAGDYRHVIISRVEPGSAADAIGLEKGDEIMSINFKSVSTMSLEEIDSIFRSRDDRSLLLEIFHDNRYDKVILTLKRRI